VLYDFDFDWRYMVRGLTIDKRRGNVLKLDRHKYVKLAYHGFRPLSREERLATYANALVRRARIGIGLGYLPPRAARATRAPPPLPTLSGAQPPMYLIPRLQASRGKSRLGMRESAHAAPLTLRRAAYRVL
jgi:hypothetical protein